VVGSVEQVNLSLVGGSDAVPGCSVLIFGKVAFLTHAAGGVAVTIAPPLRSVAALTRQNSITPAFMTGNSLVTGNECVLVNLHFYFLQTA
jgi:hypothetical protein